MSFLSKSLLGVATLALAGQVSAGQSQECLPSSVVANTVFAQAIKDPTSQQSKIWAMVSNNVSYGNKEWNVIYGLELDNANSVAEALEQGQASFKTVAMEEPQSVVFGQQVLCRYSSLDANYIVIASSPPLDLNQSMGLTKKFK